MRNTRASQSSLSRLRWGRSDHFHLTLSFLGDVVPDGEERLRTALSRVKVPPFFLPIRGLGSFGGARPTVLWAGVGKWHPHLFALHKHIQDAVLSARLTADLRAFHPHITLASPRNVSAATLKTFLKAHADHEFGMWEVKEFVLFASQPKSDGSFYSEEFRQQLQ